MTTVSPIKPRPADAVADALATRPGSTAAELTEAAGVGRSTAGKCLVALEGQGRARRTPGGRDGGRRLADRWIAVAEGSARVVAEDPGPASGRLGKGVLRALIYDYLVAYDDDPDGRGLSPTAIAKGLGGKSSGAVGNTLIRLEEEGKATLVQLTPRRYRPTGQ
jgi:hypothetical protein